MKTLLSVLLFFEFLSIFLEPVGDPVAAGPTFLDGPPPLSFARGFPNLDSHGSFTWHFLAGRRRTALTRRRSQAVERAHPG